MEWQTIRSWRDRGFWLPLACAVLLVLSLALGGDLWVRRYIQELQVLRVSNPEAAAVAAERGLRLLGQAVGGFALGCSVLLARYFQLGFREQRLPPSGWWSLGARRAAVGPRARSLSLFGLGLSVLLAAAGVGCVVATRHLLEILSHH
jgi:hypothetical protein